MTDKEIIKALECEAVPSEMNCVHGEYIEAVGIYCHKKKQHAENCLDCEEHRMAYYGKKAKATLDLINRQQEQLEAAANGQETLQKALADKDREVAELNSDLKLLRNDYEHLKTNFDETVEKNKRLRDKVVGLTAEKDRLIETFGECQERAVKDFAKAVIDGIDEGYISHSSDIVDFTADYLRGKMVGDTE